MLRVCWIDTAVAVLISPAVAGVGHGLDPLRIGALLCLLPILGPPLLMGAVWLLVWTLLRRRWDLGRRWVALALVLSLVPGWVSHQTRPGRPMADYLATHNARAGRLEGWSRARRQVAGAFPGGVYVVDLSSITDAQLVPPAIRRAVVSRDDSDALLADRITHATARGHALLVLDNCE